MRGCDSLVHSFIKEQVAIGEQLALKEMELEQQMLSHNNISNMDNVGIDVKPMSDGGKRIVFYKDVNGYKSNFATLALSNKQIKILSRELAEVEGETV